MWRVSILENTQHVARSQPAEPNLASLPEASLASPSTDEDPLRKMGCHHRHCIERRWTMHEGSNDCNCTVSASDAYGICTCRKRGKLARWRTNRAVSRERISIAETWYSASSANHRTATRARARAPNAHLNSSQMERPSARSDANSFFSTSGKS